jgi:hypothetical protein
VVLIGIEPLDELLHSNHREHRLRCVLANALLFVMMLMQLTAGSSLRNLPASEMPSACGAKDGV